MGGGWVEVLDKNTQTRECSVISPLKMLDICRNTLVSISEALKCEETELNAGLF